MSLVAAQKKLAAFLVQTDARTRADVESALKGATATKNPLLVETAFKGFVTDLSPDEAKALAGASLERTVDVVFANSAPALYERTTGGRGAPRRPDDGGVDAGSTARRLGGGSSLTTAAGARGALNQETMMGIGRGFAEGVAANGDRLELGRTRRPGGDYFDPVDVTIAGEKFVAHVSKSGGASFDPPVSSTDRAHWVVLEQDGKFTDTFGIKRFQRAYPA